jgi:nitroreductase
MNFLEIVKNRYSVRSYSNKLVEKETIERIIEAGRLAPSAVNFQPWHVVVISDPERVKQFQEVYNRSWFREAPVYLVICGDHRVGWHRKSDGKDFTDVDLSIFTEHLVLQATELGLGTCWVCNFDVRLCHELLELPDLVEPLVLLPLGYPKNGEIPEKIRKDLSEIVHWQTFDHKL